MMVWERGNNGNDWYHPLLSLTLLSNEENF